jgi:hypothetical protein
MNIHLPRWFGFTLFVGMMAAGYYYNLTFVQLGLMPILATVVWNLAFVFTAWWCSRKRSF